MNGPQIFNWFRDHAALILAVFGLIEGVLCAILLRVVKRTRAGLRAAQGAAEDAARAAAMAAPGAIDPEAVLALLREGHTPTLDNVYAMMRRRESSEPAPPSPKTEGVSEPVAS